jgi:signal recognition particle subunit SEC65
MKVNKITNIAKSLEKLGYEIIKIKERKENPDFPSSPDIIKIKITPIKSNTKKHKES